MCGFDTPKVVDRRRGRHESSRWTRKQCYWDTENLEADVSTYLK